MLHGWIALNDSCAPRTKRMENNLKLMIKDSCQLSAVSCYLNHSKVNGRWKPKRPPFQGNQSTWNHVGWMQVRDDNRHLDKGQQRELTADTESSSVWFVGWQQAERKGAAFAKVLRPSWDGLGFHYKHILDWNVSSPCWKPHPTMRTPITKKPVRTPRLRCNCGDLSYLSIYVYLRHL